MRVLVTGAAGFVGHRFVSAAAEAGHEVYAVDRDASRIAGLPAASVEHDLTTPIAPAALPAVDAVVHLAQANVALPQGAPTLLRVNTVSTADLLAHCRRCGARRFVYASTGSVYGLADHPLRESDPLAGNDLYAISKIVGEELVACYREKFATFVLRLFAPYGPGQARRMIPRLIARVRDGEAVTVDERGGVRMNPIYVDDVVRALLEALTLDGDHVVNVAGDEPVSIRELAELIGELVEKQPVFDAARAGSGGDLVADTSRLHELLSLRPLVSLREGLAATIGYHSA